MHFSLLGTFHIHIIDKNMLVCIFLKKFMLLRNLDLIFARENIGLERNAIYYDDNSRKQNRV